MKKTSIFLTAALIVVAILAGCSDSVAITGLPQSVKSGKIIQTGDFLTGQLFDPQKFSVEITYDNGTIAPADSAVSVRLVDEDDTADAGDRVEALIGYDVYGDPVYAEGSLTAYEISSIAVTGPASSSTTPKASDLTVTATYLDSTNAAKTMVLRSTEFKVDNRVFANGKGPYASMPEVSATVDVTPLVGQPVDGSEAEDVKGTFTYTATLPEAKPELPYEITKFMNVEYTGTILAVDYGTVVEPDPAFVVFRVNGDDGDNHDVTAAELDGVELSFLYEGLPLNLTDLTEQTGKALTLQVSYGEYKMPETAATTTIKEPKITITENEGFELVENEELGTASADDFRVVLSATGMDAQILPASEYEIMYVSAEPASVAEAEAMDPETVLIKDSTVVHPYVIYKGVGFTGTAITIEDAAPADTVAITGIAVNADYAWPAAQYYDDITEVVPELSALESITVEVTPVGGDKKTTPIPVAEFGNAVTVAYSKGKTEFTALENEDDLLNEDGDTADDIYLYVTYTNENGVVAEKFSDDAIDLPAPVVTGIELGVTYNGVEKAAPLYGETIAFTARTYNELGDVAKTATIEKADSYKFLVNNVETAFDDLPATADADEYTVSVFFNNGSEVVSSGSVEIPAGIDYLSDTEAAKIAVKLADPDANDLMVGETLSRALTASEFVASGYETEAGKTTGFVTVTDIVVPAGQIATQSNDILVRVSYVGDSGTTETKLVSTTVKATPYVDPVRSGFSLVTTIEEEDVVLSDGDELVADSYNFGDFEINPESYIAYCDDAAPSEDILALTAKYFAGGTGEGEDWTGIQALAEGDEVVFTITYVDSYEASQAEEKPTETITLTVIAAPEPEEP